MTCTRCFQKIAPSTLEKSCKGKHRQQGEGEGEWEFSRGAKGVCVCVWGGFAFLWVLLSLLSWPGILTHLRLILVLAHFGGFEESMFPVHLCKWREPIVKALEAELCPARWDCWSVRVQAHSAHRMTDQWMWETRYWGKDYDYSESWLTQKMANWWLRVTILSRSGCQVLL